jgi:hypothetical protein
MKIGDMDVANAIINLEYDMLMMQRILNFITEKNEVLIHPTGNDLKEFRAKAIETLQRKYPSMGIVNREM